MVLRRCSSVSAARNFSAAMRTGSVETPVERSWKRPRTGSPWVVMPLKSSARPVFSAARDICVARSLWAKATQLSSNVAAATKAVLLPLACTKCRIGWTSGVRSRPMSILACVLAAVAAICVYACVAHVFAARHPWFRGVHLTFAALALMAAVHATSHIAVYYAKDVAAYVVAE